MAKKKNKSEAQVIDQVIIKERKPLPKRKHLLIEEVTVGDTVIKAGESISLTEAGRIYFKSINKIK